MEELQLRIENYIKEKYGIDDIEYESREYFNYVYILEVIHRYGMYNNKSFTEMLSRADKLIREADSFLESE